MWLVKIFTIFVAIVIPWPGSLGTDPHRWTEIAKGRTHSSKTTNRRADKKLNYVKSEKQRKRASSSFNVSNEI